MSNIPKYIKNAVENYGCELCAEYTLFISIYIHVLYVYIGQYITAEWSWSLQDYKIN